MYMHVYIYIHIYIYIYMYIYIYVNIATYNQKQIWNLGKPACNLELVTAFLWISWMSRNSWMRLLINLSLRGPHFAQHPLFTSGDRDSDYLYTLWTFMDCRKSPPLIMPWDYKHENIYLLPPSKGEEVFFLFFTCSPEWIKALIVIFLKQHCLHELWQISLMGS